MKILALMFYAVLSLPWAACYAVSWPQVTNPRITQCETGISPCSSLVYYAHDGTSFADVQPVIPAPRTGQVLAYGVHCDAGSRIPGHEQGFSGCDWAMPSMHAPIVSSCSVSDVRTWRLSPSACNSTTIWGGHIGAGPGGECVLFGILDNGILYTPHGVISASEAANGGNRFCVKPLPPSVQCELRLNDTVLDHGVMAPSATSEVSVQGTVDCGLKPVVEVVGGTDLPLGPGVSAIINTSVDNDSRTLRVRSQLTTVNAKAQEYSGSRVITVSPW